MLGSRLEDEPASAARISYSVRHRTSERDWLFINSTNLEELASARLPTVSIQRRNLLRWFADQVEDDRFGSVRPGPFVTLAAVVGAINGDRVSELMKSVIADGYIVGTDDGGYRLTPRGWAELESVTNDAPAQGPTVNHEVLEAECPRCGPRRRADVVATHTERDPPEGLIYELTTMSVLRCRGCHTLFAMRATVFSEDEDHEQDPVSGEWVTVLRPTITYWPAREMRSRPAWFDELTDETLRAVQDETYAALNGGQLTLAAMGVRAALDRIFELAGADAGGTFAEKLNELRDGRVIGSQEYELLRIMTDAGSAASHRGWRPEPEQLSTILDAAEATLQRVTVLQGRAASLKASVPPRPPKRRKGT